MMKLQVSKNTILELSKKKRKIKLCAWSTLLEAKQWKETINNESEALYVGQSQ